MFYPFAKRLLVCALIFTAALALARPAGAEGVFPLLVKAKAEKAVGLKVKAQKLADAWAGQKHLLLLKLQALERDLASVRKRRERTQRYMDGQLAKIAAIKKGIAEAAELKRRLEPVLEQTHAALSKSLPGDHLVFDRVRKKRLADLGRVLNDYDLGLAQKGRRVFELLKAEAAASARAEVAPGEIKIAGRLLRVDLIRLGGLAVFAVSLDKSRAWRFDRAKGGFRPLEGWGRDLGRVAAMIQGKRIQELSRVPLRRPAPGSAKP